MGNDGFVWMDESERRRDAPRPASPSSGRTNSGPTVGHRLIARVLDDADAVPEEPTLAEIGAQLRLWLRAKVRRARRQAPRWAMDRLAARLSL